MNFAIIGASGNVGRKTIEILEKRKNKVVEVKKSKVSVLIFLLFIFN